MRPSPRTILIAALLLVPLPSLLAQTAADPTGHWEGSVKAPEMEVKIEVDLSKNSKGDLAGTFANPSEGLKGVPLSNVAFDGTAVTFELKASDGGGIFHGTILADGKSMSGNFVMAEGGHSLPFSAKRTGDAQITAAPKSAPIAKELEGTWSGALEVGGKQKRIILKMANQPDGSATGTIASPDGSGVEIPVAMTQKAKSVTIDVPSVKAAFAAVLNAEGTELTGTWKQGPTSLPLTLKRSR